MGRVTLTFDNGPNEEITPGVPARHNVKASFFVIGEKLMRRRWRWPPPPNGRKKRSAWGRGPIMPCGTPISR